MRSEYVYDLRSHHKEFMPVVVFGAMFARLPISAFVHKKDAPEMPLDHLELWNNFSYDIHAHEYAFLKHLRCSVLLRDRSWHDGEYMFTLSWAQSKLAEDPGDGGFKRAHVIKLDNGCYAAQPNNRIKWFEPSFITKKFPDRPDFITNSHVWNCETISKWSTEDSPAYFYSLKES